jgi:hypothetical protein
VLIKAFFEDRLCGVASCPRLPERMRRGFTSIITITSRPMLFSMHLCMRIQSLCPREFKAGKPLHVRALESARGQSACRIAGIHSVFVILFILFGQTASGSFCSLLLAIPIFSDVGHEAG